MWQWCIYYGDWTTYTSEDGSAWDAPGRNVQVVLTGDSDHNWAVVNIRDFYWYLPETDQWEGGEIFGLWDYLVRPGPKKVIFGRALPNLEFRAIVDHATQQIPKLGWRPGEPKPPGY